MSREQPVHQPAGYSAAIASLGWPIFFVIGGLVAVTGMLGPAAIPIWGAVGVFGWLTLNGPVGQALGARIRGEVEGDPVVPEEVYAELDDLRTRLLEMEERQDFAERLLAEKAGGAAGAGEAT
jgi:hypothetical protein